jgi:O-antigen ligase
LPRLALVGWIFLGIYATGSNGSLIGAAAGLAFYLLYRAAAQQDRRTARLWVSVSAILAAAGLALPMVFLSLISASRRRGGSALMRTTVWRLAGGIEKRLAVYGAGWNLFRENVLGIGPNSSAALVGGGLHNDYLAFLVERGVLGLAGLLLLIALVLACVMASVRLAQGDRARQIQTIALGGGFVANFVDAAAHEITHSRSLWLLTAMIFAQYYLLRRRASRVSRVEEDASNTLVADGV